MICVNIPEIQLFAGEIGMFRSYRQLCSQRIWLVFTIITFCLISSFALPCLAQSTVGMGERTASLKFPPKFTGDDAGSIYEVFQGYQKGFAKSQFETTDQFVSRMQALIRKINPTKSKTATDQFIFVSNIFGQDYDADSQTLSIILDPKPYAITVADDTYRRSQLIHSSFSEGRGRARQDFWQSIELWSNSKTLRTAIGQNAFGVKKKYQVKSYVSVNLALHDPRLESHQTLTFSMSPQKAREVSKNTLVAIIGTPIFPFISKDNSSEDATITNPEEAHYFDYYLLFEPKALSIFDF